MKSHKHKLYSKKRKAEKPHLAPLEAAIKPILYFEKW